MEDKHFGDSCRSLYLKMICVYVITLTVLSSANIVSAIKTYDMDEYCGNEISMIWKSIYQGKLSVSTPMSTSQCTATIETWYTLDKLMFYFENLDLPCSDGYLEFFDSEDSYNGEDDKIKGLEGRICGTMPTKVFTTEERDLKVRYTRLNNAYHSEAASIIFTSFSNGGCKSYHFKCDNGRCIDDDIRCEGYNSCGDDSGCRTDLEPGAIAGIIVGCLAGICALVTVIVLVICCKRSQRRRNTGNPYAQPVTYAANVPGQQPYVNYAAPNQPYVAGPQQYVAGQQPAYPGNVSNPGYMAQQGPAYMVHPPSGFPNPQQTQNMQAPGGQIQYPAAQPTAPIPSALPPSYGELTTEREDQHAYEQIKA